MLTGSTNNPGMGSLRGRPDKLKPRGPVLPAYPSAGLYEADEDVYEPAVFGEEMNTINLSAQPEAKFGEEQYTMPGAFLGLFNSNPTRSQENSPVLLAGLLDQTELPAPLVPPGSQPGPDLTNAYASIDRFIVDYCAENTTRFRLLEPPAPPSAAFVPAKSGSGWRKVTLVAAAVMLLALIVAVVVLYSGVVKIPLWG